MNSPFQGKVQHQSPHRHRIVKETRGIVKKARGIVKEIRGIVIAWDRVAKERRRVVKNGVIKDRDGVVKNCVVEISDGVVENKRRGVVRNCVAVKKWRRANDA